MAMAAGGRAIGWMKRGGLLAAMLPVLALGSCAETPKQSMPCPAIKPVPDASYITRFAGESEDLTDTAFEARIVSVKPMCKYIEDTDTKKTKIQSDLLVTLMASRGPKLTGEQVTFNYVIALTGRGGQKLTRQQFDVTIPLTADKPSAQVVDNPLVTIPLKQGENGDFYQIYVFLEVTEKELAYNRRNPQQ
ncbi:hypothetical protein [Dongia sp.]|uniref:hypothetical protein n=1 Tax=Dongia sp. TaxID=1977262 RepID=UPI003750DD53